MRRLAVLVAVPLALLGAVPVGALTPAHAHAAAPERVTYRPPVDAPVVDPFRAPAEKWNAGNRGLEYDTTEGEPVAAAAGGVVAFAGQVGGQLHVVVLHADGLRTTYAFLRSIDVRRGDTVAQGERVGTAADTMHFGARIGDVYVDPALLFGDGPPEVHLVPDDDLVLGSEEREQRGLLGQIIQFGGRASSRVIEWAAGEAEDKLAELLGAAHYLQIANPVFHAAHLGGAGLDWLRQRANCTPSGAPQPRLQQRHLAVLVGGLGSSTGDAAIYELDTVALGYADDDVSRFSYRGGTSVERPYESTDTDGDIRHSARLLRQHLQETAAENPGVPIDVIAHSQGGVVAREALTTEYDGLDPGLPQVSSLVTLGSPHHGTDGATAAQMFGATQAGEVVERTAALFAPWDPHGPAVGQLSEVSSFIRNLNRRPLPEGLHATSIGARGDVVVPAGHTPFAGAKSVMVPVAGILGDHDRLPGSDQAEREVALAVNHQNPTCQGFAEVMVGAFVSDHIALVEDVAGSALWAGARRTDKAIPNPLAIFKPKRGSS